MKVDKSEGLTIDGPDYVQVYLDGESHLILDSNDLDGHDVTVELHEHGEIHG